MGLPLNPPIEPMLARVRSDIPEGEGWLYEPKWDGFRALAYVDDAIHIESRDGRDLERYFPEVRDELAEHPGSPCVLDGEVIVPTSRGLDFDVLLQRIHPAASRVRLLARDTPATFVVFDILARGDDDLTTKSMVARRSLVVELLGEAPDPLSIATTPGPAVRTTPQTDDPEIARRWFLELEDVGLDGIIANRVEQTYDPGQRVMTKVKHERTADCVVGGYRLAKSGTGVGSLLLGLYDHQGILHYVGFSSAFRAATRIELLARLKPLEGAQSFGGGRTPGGPSRWSAGRDASWVSVRPELVCEVAYDHMQGLRFRHGTQFRRWRPDKPPRECTFDQLPARHRP